jgi:hypothetical protein
MKGGQFLAQSGIVLSKDFFKGSAFRTTFERTKSNLSTGTTGSVVKTKITD